MEIKSEQLAKWLNVTEQQNQVLQSIYSLESTGVEATPKNILASYSRAYGKEIQSNNLFTIIKILADEGLIVKKGKARYSVNLDSIRERLVESSRTQEKELEKVNRLIKNLSEYYKSAARDVKPQMTFYSSDELFNKIAEVVKNATVCYVTGRFPKIILSRPVAHRLWLDRYVDVLQDRCLVKKELQVVYLTQLDTEHIYNQFLYIYGDPKIAVREMETTLDNLLDNAMSNENFKVYYLPNPMGVYMSVIEKQGEPTDVFLFLQSKENVNGIHLKSREMAIQAKKSFLMALERATPLKGSKGGKIINAVKKILRENAKRHFNQK